MSWDWDKLKQQQQSRGGGAPPQMDEILDKFKKFKLPGGPLIILVIAIIMIATTTFYTVKQDEVGIVQRFGRYVRTTQPGLNFKLPIGIEKVTKVNVKQIRTEEFGFTSVQTDSRTRFRSGGENISVALMLTGDLNVALVPWIVQYRVKNPYDFLFRVRNVRRLLIDMSEATMRLVVGDRSINEVISKRNEIAVEARGLLQKELDQAQTGIHIVTIEMKTKSIRPPRKKSKRSIRPGRTITRPSRPRVVKPNGPLRRPKAMPLIGSIVPKVTPQGSHQFIRNTLRPRMSPSAGCTLKPCERCSQSWARNTLSIRNKRIFCPC